MPKDEAQASTAIVPAAELELAYAAILDGEPLPIEASDPEQVSRVILERIMQSDSIEAVLTPQSLPAWRDSLDRPAVVQSFRFNRSSFEQGSSVYIVADLAWQDTGELEAVSIGGRNVMVQLLRMMQLGALSTPVRLTSRKTGEGYQVLWLEPA